METKVKDLKIVDVLLMPEYVKNVKSVYKEWQHVREQSKRRSHPFDRLPSNPEELTVMYAQLRDGQCKCTAIERTIINAIGTEAFKRTMKKLIDNEKAGNNSNGKD